MAVRRIGAVGPKATDTEYWCQQIMATWMKANGARAHDPRYSCLRLLENPRHRCSQRCRDHPSTLVWKGRFSALDHPEWWKTPAGALILTAHPYLYPVNDSFPSDPTEHRCYQELAAYCLEHGLQLEIDRDGSWYRPYSTILLVIRGKPQRIRSASDDRRHHRRGGAT